MAGIDYSSVLGNGIGGNKALPFNNKSSAWWNPGESKFLFGGDATKGMQTGPASGDYQTGYLKNMLNNNGQGPQMDTSNSSLVRGQQGQLADMLFQQANGQRQGAGELAVQRQVNNAMANNTSASQMARGSNTAMAMRNAARTNADIGVNGAGQAGIAQLQDQQSATNQLGGLLGTTRGQDIQIAGANQQAGLAQQQLNLGALAQMLGVDEASLKQDLAKRGIDATDKGAFASLLQAGGSMMAASDRNLKTEIDEDAGTDVDLVLDGVRAKAYRYRDEKYGRGARLGVMAQDFENSHYGRAIVHESPDGKMLDVNAALSFALAAVVRLNKRIRDLEGR